MFRGNSASLGGAIALMQSDIWYLYEKGTIVFDRNEAERGSAVAIAGLSHSLNSTRSIHDVQFTSNVAFVGGTVYWLQQDGEIEPPGLQSSSNLWTGNAAQYGLQWATQPVKLSYSPTYVISVYGSVALSPGKLLYSLLF